MKSPRMEVMGDRGRRTERAHPPFQPNPIGLWGNYSIGLNWYYCPASHHSASPDVVRASQQKLTEEGYKPGTPDGKMGLVTRAAIRKYQEHEGLKVTATLDESTAVAFGHRWRQDRGHRAG